MLASERILVVNMWKYGLYNVKDIFGSQYVVRNVTQYKYD